MLGELFGGSLLGLRSVYCFGFPGFLKGSGVLQSATWLQDIFLLVSWTDRRPPPPGTVDRELRPGISPMDLVHLPGLIEWHDGPFFCLMASLTPKGFPFFATVTEQLALKIVKQDSTTKPSPRLSLSHYTVDGQNRLQTNKDGLG